MTILDVAARLNTLDDLGVIFASLIDGEFMPESQAVIVALTDAELSENVSQVANGRCPGLVYCLEVSVANEAVTVWSLWRNGRIPSAIESAQAICHKANADPWGPPVT